MGLFAKGLVFPMWTSYHVMVMRVIQVEEDWLLGDLVIHICHPVAEPPA